MRRSPRLETGDVANRRKAVCTPGDFSAVSKASLESWRRLSLAVCGTPFRSVTKNLRPPTTLQQMGWWPRGACFANQSLTCTITVRC